LGDYQRITSLLIIRRHFMDLTYQSLVPKKSSEVEVLNIRANCIRQLKICVQTAVLRTIETRLKSTMGVALTCPQKVALLIELVVEKQLRFCTQASSNKGQGECSERGERSGECHKRLQI